MPAQTRGHCMQAHPGPKLLRDWIGQAAARDPDKPWIVCADGGRSISYGQLWESTGRVAGWLQGRGLARNDRVALLAHNSVEHLLCYFGVMAYGATICTVHVEMNRNQLDNIFARLKPKLVLYQDELGLDDLLATLSVPRIRLGHWDAPAADTFFAQVAACAPVHAQTAAEPNDDAVILFTSGTSARPKGVVLDYREHLANIGPSADGFGISAQDRV
jgi:long-chain acyl-CoA synthetase